MKSEMVKLSSLAILLVMFILSASHVSAQTIPSPELMSAQTKQMIEKMEDIKGSLQLTAAQDTIIRETLNSNLEKMLAVMKSHDIKPGEKLSFEQKLSLSHDLKPIRQTSDKKLEEVLSSAQMDEFKEIRNQTHEEIKAKSKD